MFHRQVLIMLSVIGVAGLCGCSSMSEHKSVEMESKAFPQMTYKLTGPAIIYHNAMPTTDNPQRHPDERFVLKVTNDSRTDYQGQSPTTAAVRVVITSGGQEVGHGPAREGQMVTPVKIAAGMSKHFSIESSVDNSKLVADTVKVEATFVPTGEVTTITIPVETTH